MNTEQEFNRQLRISVVTILSNPKAKLTNPQRKRLKNRLARRLVSTVEPKPVGEKYIVQLSGLAMRQLIRRLRQASRISAHCGYEVAKNPEGPIAKKYQLLQDNALACLKHIQTEIEYRTSGKSKKAV